MKEARLAQTYIESGWCFVEAAISAGLKVGKRRLDLGKRTERAMGHAYGGRWNSGVMLEGVCAAAREPPLLPDEVRRLLETEKQFTASADVDVVDQLYRSFFDGATRSATRLDFNGLAWGDEEARRLIAVLPRFVALVSLDVSSNELGVAGAGLLAVYVQESAVLTSIDVGFNNLDEEAALGIVRAVRQHDKMTNLGLARCKIGPTGAKEVADYVSGTAVLTECSLLKNDLDIESAKMLAKIGTEKRIMLSGMKRDQTEASFRNQGLKPADGILIVSDLPFMAVVKNLSLNYNPGISGEAAQRLAEVVLASKSLEVFSEVPIKELREDKLTELDLKSKGLGPAEGIVIAKLVVVTAVLTTIDLQYNGFDASAKNALADAVKRRTAPLDLKL